MSDLKLSVMIPVFNEVNTILEVLRLVQEEKHNKEIIIVDDGSTDGTRELLAQIKADNVRVVLNECNRGKGYSIRQAIPLVTGDIAIIQDADLECYPNEYEVLIEKIVEDKADVVYGSRFMGAHRVFHFYHFAGNWLLNTIANIILDINLTDLMTAYKAFRVSALKSLHLEADRFGIEAEITAEVFKRHNRVYEVPISYNGRSFDEGKKIRWTDFFSCLSWVLRASLRFHDLGQDNIMRKRTMKNNNLWTFSQIRQDIGSKVLEVGSGIGTFSNYMVSKDRDLTLMEADPDSVRYLRQRFIANPRVKILQEDVCRVELAGSPERFDTVVAINVLERIEDDRAAMARMKSLLSSGGKIVLIVPAHAQLFSKFDRVLGHCRRYTKKGLREMLEKEGLSVERLDYMNLPGALGWFLNFRLLGRSRMSIFSAGLVDKFIPLVASMEKYFRPDFGLSIICVAELK